MGIIKLADGTEVYAVLGHKENGEVPSKDTIVRVHELVENIKRSTDKCIIVFTGWDNELKNMYRLFTEKMVGEDMRRFTILQDAESASTVDSIKWLKSNGFNRANVITSDYHAFRTRIICSKLECSYKVISAIGANSLFKSIGDMFLAAITMVCNVNFCGRFSKVR